MQETSKPFCPRLLPANICLSSGWLFWSGALILLAYMLHLSSHYGVAIDEVLQDHYGHKVFDYFASLGGDKAVFNYRNLYYYGGFFDLVATVVEKSKLFATSIDARHALN